MGIKTTKNGVFPIVMWLILHKNVGNRRNSGSALHKRCITCAIINTVLDFQIFTGFRVSDKLEKLADEVWNKVVENIKKVLEECDLHGISEIIYVKDPSVEERLGLLEELETLFGIILAHIKKDDVKTKISDSKICINFLKVLLVSVRSHDEASFNFAKDFLKKHIVL
jgi:hypothetical protein